jgi:membrane-bound inhibitor of C-type lysozyme
MTHRFILSSVIIAALAGCTHSAIQTEEVASADFIKYECESDRSFEVAYLVEQEAAILRLPKHDYRMIQIPSGSGTKYILDDGTAEKVNPMTLYTKGEGARLELGRVIYKNCVTN